ncbi:putative pentatricopeptide repeat-containing protein [Iris pallida]|uniref:Pentatricopeptide repeat-containing protein n=1 Tax=Iris pallida TaxID=29817 RepID=A0AAX6FKH5_IRIPA|nr:putative pentatricopeptide repeat-containing protein [Iris pallida]
MSSSAVSAAATASGAVKICFNSYCKDPKSDPPRRKGWRLRAGDHAQLCDRCFYAFEQGNFCETFHSDAAGWRKCELCQKRIHCGCIVSLPAYILLDAGGVECMTCARRTTSTSTVAQNQMWASSLLLAPQPQVPERPKEYPVKSWNQGTGTFPGQWRQASHMWSAAGPQSELQQRLAFEFDRPPNAEKLISLSRPPISTQDRRMGDLPERRASSSMNHVARDRYGNGTTGDNDQMSTRKGVISDPCTTSSPGVNFEPHTNSSGKPSIVKGDLPASLNLAAPLSSPNAATDLCRVSTTQPQRQMAPPLPKQITPSPHNMSDPCSEFRKSRVDARARAQMLPRYWPRITDQELQQISGNSNSVITPLFEKMLSASDAGRIGRLVLPKKCAEAYFPAISQPEGLPLRVQDASGKEWVFQFRFWPNNNSRMYVLEGVTPCIQSMQLQAGDTVTFSRIDPEGKLVMGFRKASGSSSEQQENQTVKTGNGLSTPPEVNKSSADDPANGPTRPQKDNIESKNPVNEADQSKLSKFVETEFIQKDGSTAKSSQGPTKRKGGAFGCKSKRLRIENEDSIELKLTWEEAQELLRPPPNDVPSVVVIEGHEFEEYEEAPVLGKPTIFTTNQAGDNNQWAQCEECSKWRKLPVDALLPSRWTCSENRWDSERVMFFIRK